MQFFKHYSNMRNDIKIKRLMKRYGIEGYGLYNLIIESITESLASDKPIPELEETAQDFAEQYHNDTVHINEMMAFMLNQGLFEINEINGRILCHKIYKFIDKSQTRSTEIRQMIEKYKLCLGQSQTLQDNSDRSRSRSRSRIEVDKEKKGFAPPSLPELQEYITSNNFNVDALSFIDFYSSKGWMVGKNKMKDWQAAVRNWGRRDNGNNKKSEMFRTRNPFYESLSDEELDKLIPKEQRVIE